ncbi:MAG: choice-of-anchor K domain-containing protein [Cyanobacteria bacterium J06648_16]
MIQAKVLKVTALGVALLLAGAALPTAAQSFTGSSTGRFGTPITGPDSVFSGVGTPTFTAGEPTSSSTTNVLTFTGNAFTSTTDSPFSLGKLSYTNGKTLSGTEVEAVPLTIDLTFSNRPGLMPSFTFDFDFETTVNNGIDPVADADRLIATTAIPAQAFAVDGTVFTLELLGFRQNGAIDNEFFAFEDVTTSGTLLGQITRPENVPEPLSTLALGWFAVVGMAWRRTRQV